MSDAITLSRAVELHALHLAAVRRSPKTIEWYDEQLHAYQQWANAYGIGDRLPTAGEIDEFLAMQHALRLKPSTVHARWRALRAVLRFLEKRRHITHDANPAHLVTAPTVPREVRRYVTQADFDRLLASIDGQHWLDWRDRVSLLLLFYSGLRVSELCGLEVSDIDTEHLIVTVRRGKGDKARLVPMHPTVPRELVGYLYNRPAHLAQLLLASDGHIGIVGHLQREGARQMLIRRCQAAGMRPYNPHAFRHGFAMWTLNNGARLTTVSALMGHADTNVTQQVYAHSTLATVQQEYQEALRRTRNAAP